MDNFDCIKINRIISDSEAAAKIEVRPEKCLICKKNSDFCNSHSIPAQCLRVIAIKGEIQTFNGIIKLEL